MAGLFLVVAAIGFAQATGTPVPSLNIGVNGSSDKEQMSTSLQLLALLTVLSVAPAMLILTTAFTRIVIVMSFVRTALGTPSIPPNQVLIGLSLFLTFFVMGPTYNQINETAIKPYMRAENPIQFEVAMERAEQPLREFMIKNTYASDLDLFLSMRDQTAKTVEEVELWTLIPAFVISELKTAFIIGFYIFIPFILIDLMVASVLMGMGMMMMPPVVVSLPAKILVFILADGWNLLIRTLLQGYM
ncbi:MAG: flagellar type III secretion system pore protein FliP [Fimbriimonadaceae bacterium]|nr:flagellar type III secretion system pore protein FliP [Fimbriimonadaceae bacterium]